MTSVRGRPGVRSLTSRFGRAFMAAAGIMLLAALITAATIRIRKADLAGVNPI